MYVCMYAYLWLHMVNTYIHPRLDKLSLILIHNMYIYVYAIVNSYLNIFTNFVSFAAEESNWQLKPLERDFLMKRDYVQCIKYCVVSISILIITNRQNLAFNNFARIINITSIYYATEKIGIFMPHENLPGKNSLFFYFIVSSCNLKLTELNLKHYFKSLNNHEVVNCVWVF